MGRYGALCIVFPGLLSSVGSRSLVLKAVSSTAHCCCSLQVAAVLLAPFVASFKCPLLSFISCAYPSCGYIMKWHLTERDT